MLRSQSFMGAIPLAQSLSSQGLSLVAKPNTVLSELVRNTLIGFDHPLEDETGFGNYATALQNSTMGTMDDPGEHNRELAGLIDDLSMLVTKHISYAKNVVKPAVVQFAEELNQYLEASKVIDPSEAFNIVSINTPVLLADDSFLDIIKPYNGKNILTPDIQLKLVGKTEDEIHALMLTGNNRTDKLVGEWILSCEPNFASKIWFSFFTTEKYDNVINYNNLSGLNAFEALNYSLAIFLISRKLFNTVETDAGTSGMTLAAYQNIVAQYRDYAGSLLASSLNKVYIATKNAQLVIENVNGKVIKVNDLLYKEWLASGGKPEVLLGLMTSSKALTSVSAINEQAEALTSQWNSYCMFYKANENTKAFSNFKNYLYHAFAASYSHQDETEKEYYLKNANMIQSAKLLAEKQIEHLRTSDMNDAYGVSLRLIAKCRFAYTSAYNILSDINEVGKINPNVDVREAALLAAINYMSCYVATMVSVG